MTPNDLQYLSGILSTAVAFMIEQVPQLFQVRKFSLCTVKKIDSGNPFCLNFCDFRLQQTGSYSNGPKPLSAQYFVSYRKFSSCFTNV